MTLLRNIVLLLVLSLLQACSGDSGYMLKPQVWHGTEIDVEVRPNPPRVGMNEFLVVTTKADKRPAYDLIVSLRTSKADHWEQSIQDGDSGVYRRAIRVRDPLHDILSIQLRRDKEVAVLHFPLTQIISGNKLKPHS